MTREFFRPQARPELIETVSDRMGIVLDPALAEVRRIVWGADQVMAQDSERWMVQPTDQWTAQANAEGQASLQAVAEQQRMQAADFAGRAIAQEVQQPITGEAAMLDARADQVVDEAYFRQLEMPDGVQPGNN